MKVLNITHITSAGVSRGTRGETVIRGFYYVAAFLLAVGLGSAGVSVGRGQNNTPDDMPARDEGITQCLHYDQIQQRFIHNAYSADRDGHVEDFPGIGLRWVAVGGQKEEQLLDQLIYHRVRALELDLHPRGDCVSPYPDQPDWYIYHDCFDITSSNVRKLSDALEQLRSFHQAQPQHEVITVNLELGSLKTGKGSESEFGKYNPDDLDDALRAGLGDALFTPKDLLRLNNQDEVNGSLFEAVRPKTMGGPSGWPTTDDLRGKFIFVIHGDEGSQPGDVANYLGNGNKTVPNQRVAFEIDEERWRTLTPQQFATDAPHIVFHSELDFTGDLQRLHQQLPGHILRIRQIDDGNAGQLTSQQYEANMKAAQASGANFLYMDIVHVPAYPFVRIFNDNLYPFGANVPKADGTFPVGSEVWTHPAVINKIEPGSMFVLGDRSGGDLDGQNDKFIFATYNAQATGLSESWTAEIASASNLSVHSYSKGMIMARESLAPNSRYFAVGRTGDAHGLVVLYRDHDNNGTGYHEYDSSRYKENWAFVKLELIPYVVNGQNHTLCRGYGSHTGIDGTWGQIGQDIDIEGTLPFRGLAVSSNSGYDFGRIHIPILNYDNGYLTLFHFVNLRRSVNGGAADLLDLNQFQPQGINGATDAFVQRLYQPSLSCRNLMFDSDPNVCGAQVDLPPALFGHCGTATFNPPAGSIFPVGTTTVTATTPGGANCTFTVTVRDAQEPTVTSFVSRPMLSKLDNDLVIVGFTANATDNCSGVSPVQVSVFSDEDDAVGSNFAPDARDIGVGALRLRAERDSSADGRVYLIVVTATDAQGNVGFSCTTVVVPKDQSQASIDSVNAQAAAARAYCTANNGASPPGFFVVGDGPVIGPKQ